jgi:spore coat polysaccharide biosynthesis protein SpsF
MTGGRVVAIVQARVGSTRLPGKVLMDLGGRPMVARVIERARATPGVALVAAAIPDLPEDDVLARACDARGALVVRGPSEDVLARYALAAEASRADVVMRLTADCPLLSPRVSAHVLAEFVDCEYASNTLRRTYPRGLDTEVFSAAALRHAERFAIDPVEREHVTPFIYRHPERFRLRAVVDLTDRSGMRWTVDTPEDLAFASAVYHALGDGFEMDDVLDLLERRPELARLNRDSIQKPL